MERKGQALITLLFFIVVGISITSAAAIILVNNIASASTSEQGTDAYEVAESGIENALLELLRNPSYSGETLFVGNGTCVIQVTNGNPITILSTGTYNNSVRKIQVQVVYNNSILTISTWKEIN
jgi:hypothetical protein